MDIDLIRAIVRFDSGDLQTSQEAWELLAETEHEMMTNPEMSEYHYGLFGAPRTQVLRAQSCSGRRCRIPVRTWSDGLQRP